MEGWRAYKAVIKKRATKKLAQSNYVSCCIGLVSKDDLAKNFHYCPYF